MIEEKLLYLGSSVENIDKAKTAIHAIQTRGWKLTHDWTMAGIIEDDHLMPAYAIAMIQGVLRADVVCILLPGGRGAHIEMGAALGAGKPVIIYADNFELLKSGGNSGRPSSFYKHPLIHVVKTQEEFATVADLLFTNISRACS